MSEPEVPKTLTPGSSILDPEFSKCAIKMRGIPYSTKLQDVVDFFDGYAIGSDAIKIGVYPDGKLTGEVSILFPNEEMAS